MGVSIYGWVEVRDGKEWFGVINISEIIDDDYDMFGMLFGAKNYTGFEPIAEAEAVWMEVGLKRLLA